jgi:hypothetical protein
MITEEKLDALRLDEVQLENFAAEEDVLDALTGASEQGRQGWGVRREQAALLGLARSTRVLAKIASQAETAQNSLKGEQMAHGRTKKRLAAAEAGRQELAEVANAATLDKLETTARIADLETQVGDLNVKLLQVKASENTVTLDK